MKLAVDLESKVELESIAIEARDAVKIRIIACKIHALDAFHCLIVERIAGS